MIPTKNQFVESLNNEELLSQYFLNHNNIEKEKIREKLILKNMGLVYSCLNSFLKRKKLNKSYKDDLIQTCLIEIYESIPRYNKDLGVKFVTYIYKNMWFQMTKFYLNNKTIIRTPRGNEFFVKKINEKIYKNGENFNNLKHLGFKDYQISSWLNNPKKYTSMDETISKNNETVTLHDILKNDELLSLEDIISIKEIISIAKKVLNDREYDVFINHSLNEDTLKSLTGKYNVTKEMIRQVKISGFSKIKKILKLKNLNN